MPEQNHVQWRQKLERAIQNNAQLAHTRFFQLATVDKNQMPACRTVVFRGFMDNTHALIVHTDVRSEKILQLRNNAHGEICWYFSDTREQFRLTSKVTLITGEEHHGADIRLAHWRALSDKAQASYGLATPGSALVIEPAQSASADKGLPPRSNPLENFALLLITPFRVDHLLLMPSPQQRTLYDGQPDGQWNARRIGL
ncbi:MAG: pyridoxamine 5'-phosphate oxidase [Paraglaciecola sp.]|jgi:pyridoxamine 5'-phosphate oxidase